MEEELPLLDYIDRKRCEITTLGSESARNEFTQERRKLCQFRKPGIMEVAANRPSQTVRSLHIGIIMSRGRCQVLIESV